MPPTEYTVTSQRLAEPPTRSDIDLTPRRDASIHPRFRATSDCASRRSVGPALHRDRRPPHPSTRLRAGGLLGRSRDHLPLPVAQEAAETAKEAGKEEGEELASNLQQRAQQGKPD
jgi:hypothetical protein